MKNETRQIIALMAVSLTLVGCATTSGSVSDGVITSGLAPVVIVKERSFANCPKYSSEKTLAILSNKSLWNEHQRSAVLVPNDLSQWNPDFNRSTVLVLSLGQNKTQGMRVHSGSGLKRVGDELRVPVAISKPASGVVVGTAPVNPCMYLQVMGADYKVVSVIDQASGKVMLKSAL